MKRAAIVLAVAIQVVVCCACAPTIELADRGTIGGLSQTWSARAPIDAPIVNARVLTTIPLAMTWSRDRIRVVDPRSGVLLGSPGAVESYNAAISASGQYIVTSVVESQFPRGASQTVQVAVWGVRDGQQVASTHVDVTDGMLWGGVAISGDGTLIALPLGGDRLLAWHWQTGNRMEARRRVRCVLGIIGNDKALWYIDAAGRIRRMTYPPSQDQDQDYTGPWVSTDRLCDTVLEPNSMLAAILQMGLPYFLGFGATPRVDVIDILRGQIVIRINTCAGWVMPTAISADGRWLAAATPDAIHLIDLQTAGEVADLKLPGVVGIGFTSADNKLICIDRNGVCTGVERITRQEAVTEHH